MDVTDEVVAALRAVADRPHAPHPACPGRCRRVSGSARIDPETVRSFVDEMADELSGLSRREATKHRPGG